MISKDRFLELRHLKSLGVPTTTICKKIGISAPGANKWLRLDEDAFENFLQKNTPYKPMSETQHIPAWRAAARLFFLSRTFVKPISVCCHILRNRREDMAMRRVLIPELRCDKLDPVFLVLSCYHFGLLS